MNPSAFDIIGGEWALRAIIHDFVDNMIEDPMIGFFFIGVDPHRLRDKEYEMTARFLGKKLEYTGKNLRDAHKGRPIFGGQFDRRRQLLLEAMKRHQVPPEIETLWLSHVDQLRSQIVR